MNILSARSCFPTAALSAALVLSFGDSSASAGVVTVGGLDWTTATTSGTSVLVSDGGPNGQGNVTGVTTLVLLGPDNLNAPGFNTEVTASRTFAVAGQLSFSYQGTTADAGGWGADLDVGDPNDGGRFDKVGYRVNALETTLSPASSAFPAEVVSGGPIVLNLVAGQTVTFFAHSFDELNGAATLEISNLSFTPVPEPAGMAVIAGAGLVGFAAWRRRGTAAR
jgi:hypothetical protein